MAKAFESAYPVQVSRAAMLVLIPRRKTMYLLSGMSLFTVLHLLSNHFIYTMFHLIMRIGGYNGDSYYG